MPVALLQKCAGSPSRSGDAVLDFAARHEVLEDAVEPALMRGKPPCGEEGV